ASRSTGDPSPCAQLGQSRRPAVRTSFRHPHASMRAGTGRGTRAAPVDGEPAQSRRVHDATRAKVSSLELSAPRRRMTLRLRLSAGTEAQQLLADLSHLELLGAFGAPVAPIVAV